MQTERKEQLLQTSCTALEEALALLQVASDAVEEVASDEASHPDLATDLADALHHCAELLQKLSQQGA